MWTEAEAATKWCPEFRQVWARREPTGTGWNTTGQPSFNAAQIEKGGAFMPLPCIGSACMMWRWSVPPRRSPQPGDLIVQQRVDPDLASDLAKILDREPSGYCGKAGRP